MNLIIYLLNFIFAILMIIVFPIYFASAEIIVDDSAQIDVININFTPVNNNYVTDRSEQSKTSKESLAQ